MEGIYGDADASKNGDLMFRNAHELLFMDNFQADPRFQSIFDSYGEKEPKVDDAAEEEYLQEQLLQQPAQASHGEFKRPHDVESPGQRSAVSHMGDASPQLKRGGDFRRSEWSGADDMSTGTATDADTAGTPAGGDRPRKPGRKPLQSEPLDKRKAQNRAAQRAFRERRENAIKSLQDRVSLLEQQNTEKDSQNSLLRSEIRRLTGELSILRGRPFTFNMQHPRPSESGGDAAKGNKADDSPSLEDLPSLSNHESSGTECKSSPETVDGSPSSAAQSKSSANSKNPSDQADETPATGCGDGETDFCRKLSMACGTKDEPIPKAKSWSFSPTNLSARGNETVAEHSFRSDASGFDVSLFSPREAFGSGADTGLFSSYRDDPSILDFEAEGFNDNGEFPETANGASFDEAFGTALSNDTSPGTLFGNANTSTDLKSNHTTEDGEDEDEDEVLNMPPEENYLTCPKIWQHIQKRVGTEHDIDSLCSEMRSKAKCSMEGPVLTEREVDTILNEMTAKHV